MSTLHAPRPTIPTPSAEHPRRSTAGYWIAGLVALLGLATAFVWAAFGALTMLNAADGFARTPLPGAVTVHVTHAGSTVVVYYEGEPVPSRADLGIRVSDLLGNQVPLRPYDTLLQYDAPAQPHVTATAVGSFEAPLSGAYTVTSGYTAPAVDTRLAVGEDIAGTFIGRMVAPTALAAGSVLGAGLVLSATAVYRRRPVR